jgi:2-deoxy-D-gluconate 3-dehydrogenase
VILDRFRLDGKVALVTGASRGLGQAMAVGLAEAGADVVGVARASDQAETKASVERAGRRFVPVLADLSDKGAPQTIMDAVKAAFGRIDILVNNAAGQRRNAILDFTEDDWDFLLQLNIKSLYFLSKLAVVDMLARKGNRAGGPTGKIINVASLLAYQGGLRVGAYTATKGAVAQLTKAMANELAPLGINVNAIAPGYFETDMNEALLNDPVRLPQISERIPAGRWGKPEDLKGAVVFLASSASDFVHGQALIVDGGWMGR